VIASGARAGLALPPTRRWMLWGFRALVIAVLGLALLLGGRDLIRDAIQPQSIGGPAGAPASSFPQAAAEAYAARFAIAYETFDSANQDSRSQSLAQFLPDGADATAGWAGNGKQTASTALPSGINVHSPSSATVDVAVLVDGGRWLYLAVPVVVSGDRLVVPATPALVPAPPKASVSPTVSPVEDTQLTGQVNSDLVAFFKAYASSSSELGLIAAPGAAIEGLNGSVQFDSLAELHVLQGQGTTRQAIAHVRWFDPASGANLIQHYQLTLVQLNQVWRVASVAPAGL
jgi:Conjugative transposon protein TcpC